MAVSFVRICTSNFIASMKKKCLTPAFVNVRAVNTDGALIFQEVTGFCELKKSLNWEKALQCIRHISSTCLR